MIVKTSSAALAFLASSAVIVPGVAFGQATGAGEPAAGEPVARSEMSASAGSQQSLLRSKYENFTLKVGGALQFRYIAEWTDNEGRPSAGFPSRDTVNQGFEVARTRIDFSGQAGDPSQRYMINVAIDNLGTTSVLDLFFEKDYDTSYGKWTTTVGQFKIPVWYEWAVSERTLPFVERSLVDGRFQGLYGQGISLAWMASDARTRVIGQWTDGLRSGNINTRNARGNQYALTGRFDHMINGEFKSPTEYRDLTAFKGEEKHFRVGAAVHWQDGDPNVGGVNSPNGAVDNGTEILQWSVDAQYGVDGMTLYGAFIAQYLNGPDTLANSTEYGLMLQGGYFIKEDVELLARFEYGNLDGGQGSNTANAANDELYVVTVGANYFIIPSTHALKWTNDIGYSLNGVNAGWNGTFRGYTPDNAGEDYHVTFRSQLQVLF